MNFERNNKPEVFLDMGMHRKVEFDTFEKAARYLVDLIPLIIKKEIPKNILLGNGKATRIKHKEFAEIKKFVNLETIIIKPTIINWNPWLYEWKEYTIKELKSRGFKTYHYSSDYKFTKIV